MLVDCNIEVTSTDYWAGRAQSRRKLQGAGFNLIKWVTGCSGGGQMDSHKWRVKYSAQEDLTVLALLSNSISTEYQDRLLAEKAELEKVIATHKKRIKEIELEIGLAP